MAKDAERELASVVVRLTNFYIEAMEEAGLTEEQQQAVLYGVMRRQFEDLVNGVDPRKA